MPRGYLEDNWGDPSSWLLLLAVVDSLLSELKPGVQENTTGLPVKM
jgi:hypothetical protein